MLPTILTTIFSILMELSYSSPVYNMQPAYITATIGSTGRNIRNLPCISRKSNQNGVCMFAIDCLKANGTHLGTCIDRFYFGSCCHIEPLHDIVENTIDTALIPARKPPNRVSSTTEKTTTIETTTETTRRTKPTNFTKLTTIAKITHATAAPVKTTTIFVTRKPPTKIITKVPETEETTSFKFTTFQSVDGNDITTTIKPFITIKPTHRPSSSKPVKPQSTKPVTSSKPTKPPFSSTRPKPITITKPNQNITVIHRTTQKPFTKPKPSKLPTKITKPTHKITTSIRPLKNTTKPIRITTIKDTITTTPFITTKKPTDRITTFTTVEKITTLIPEKVTTPTTTKLTTILQKITTLPPITTTVISNSSENFVKLPQPVKEEVTTTVKSTTVESNELPVNLNASGGVLGAVSGNPATNEIESEKPMQTEAPLVEVTTYPPLVTWAQINDNYTTDGITASSSSTEEPEDWVPITTPDGWVLIPSLSTTTESTSPSTLNASKIEELSSSTSTSSSSSSIMISSSESSTSTTDGSSTVSQSSSELSISQPSSEMIQLTDSTPSTSALSSDKPIASIPDSVTTSSTQNPVNMSDFTDVCGRRMFPEARIVGGEKSAFGKWPWQISLRQWRTSTYLHKCGAALLNENWAITAAHCVDNVPPSDLLLRLGEHDLSTESEPYLHQERRVQIVASHPQFDPRTFEYDLALLRFYEPVQFQPNIIPVCVPQNDENFVGRTAYVTGWGRLYEDGPLPSILQEVSVPVINNTVCESMYRSAGYIEHIPHIFICAGWRRGGFDSCEGDSGGPMVIQRPDKRFLLAGVISWGIGCAEPNQPGVYTRISEFRDWINQILQF